MHHTRKPIFYVENAREKPQWELTHTIWSKNYNACFRHTASESHYSQKDLLDKVRCPRARYKRLVEKTHYLQARYMNITMKYVTWTTIIEASDICQSFNPLCSTITLSYWFQKYHTQLTHHHIILHLTTQHIHSWMIYPSIYTLHNTPKY